MKTIKVEELRAGVMFNKPVFIDSENILLPANIPLRDKDIERLKKWNIKSVQTEGEAVTEAASKRGSGPLAESLRMGPNAELLTKYVEMVKTVEDLFRSLERDGKHSTTELNSKMDEFIQIVEDHPDQLIAFTLQKRLKAPQSAMSAVNCTIFSLVIGQNLKLPGHRLSQLAFGGLLHDLGMTKVPSAVLDKQGDLTPEEAEQIHTHATSSYSIIVKTLGYPEEVGQIGLQHHERWDGKGYPSGLSGKGIALAARIVSVADAFEAMVRDRPYRNPMIGYQAMKQLLNDNSRRFDSEILKIFVKAMGIYPIGSIVLMSDGSIGRVERIHSDAPLRPVIQLLVDKHGRRLSGEQSRKIDLLEEKSLFIARAIGPKEANETTQ